MFRTDPFADINRFFAPVGRPTLPVEAVRRDDEVEVRLDLPGVERDDIDVQIDERTLTIRAERPRPTVDDETVLIDERRYGTFHRQLRLAAELDADTLEASYVDGVLVLKIPVLASATPRRVEIGVGASATADSNTA